jgi:LuxR family maltose regulon positive regulatory protein
MTELREADLRFTTAEAVAFFNEVMELNLSTENIATLATRTEGWVAGLQLAALSIQKQQDPTGFITAFAGDDHYIVDYLAAEVLNQQPEETQQFLLQT